VCLSTTVVPAVSPPPCWPRGILLAIYEHWPEMKREGKGPRDWREERREGGGGERRSRRRRVLCMYSQAPVSSSPCLCAFSSGLGPGQVVYLITELEIACGSYLVVGWERKTPDLLVLLILEGKTSQFPSSSSLSTQSTHLSCRSFPSFPWLHTPLLAAIQFLKCCECHKSLNDNFHHWSVLVLFFQMPSQLVLVP